MTVLAFILVALLVTGLISFGFARILRSTGLAFAASAVTTVMLISFLLLGIYLASNEAFIGIYFLLLFFIPCVFPISFACVVFIRHVQKRTADTSEVQNKQNGDPLPDRRS